jgi:hypothetical protein
MTVEANLHLCVAKQHRSIGSRAYGFQQEPAFIAAKAVAIESCTGDSYTRARTRDSRHRRRDTRFFSPFALTGCRHSSRHVTGTPAPPANDQPTTHETLPDSASVLVVALANGPLSTRRMHP